jgi:glyoxylase-like metal-dependent hydrolase (beta-lactamase superfamily II)
LVAKRSERNPASAAGDWYIDTRCIDCAASREVAPDLIIRVGGRSVFARQPASVAELQAAWRAALLCPTASVGTEARRPQPPGLFPQAILDGVYRCGYNARSSFGAHAYFLRRASGNVMVDSPRYVARLTQAFEQWGGLADILLTHQDDVADAARYARHFRARVWIHEQDAASVPYATNLLQGEAPLEIGAQLTAIPLPGHTRGSVVYLWNDSVLFAGDSLAWDRVHERPTAFRDACWYSWSELKRSLARLTAYRFEWLLPGHGHSAHRSVEEMRSGVAALVERM